MAMPYSTVFKPTANNAHLLIPTGMQNGGGGVRTIIPAGVAQVIVTWRGYEAVTVHRYIEGIWSHIHIIPASSTAEFRTSGVLTVASDVEHSLALKFTSVTTPGQATLTNNYVAGVQIIPLATPGGV